MFEINKLRTRLKNVSKGTSEYRMTVAEAQSLLQEVDALEKKANRPQLVKEVVKEVSDPKIWDGGSL